MRTTAQQGFFVSNHKQPHSYKVTTMSSNNSQKRENRKTRRDEEFHPQKPGRSRTQEPANDKSVDLDEYEKKPLATKPIEPLTEGQRLHLAALQHENFVIAIGSAGTGKTYLSAAVAAELYKNGQAKRIIMSRPPVEVGPKLGYLPGDIDDKFAPYLEPFKPGLIDRLGTNKFKCDYKSRILAKPLAYMRGATFDDAIMLLDEAQNTSVAEMKMFLTRAGTNSRIFISGDINQTDLGNKETGLSWLVRQIEKRNKAIEIIRYTREDCIRSGLCADMLELIENEV